MGKLLHYRHHCGEPLLVGEAFLGYQLMPTFHTRSGERVKNCPDCGQRLNMSDCWKMKPGEIDDLEQARDREDEQERARLVSVGMG